MPLSAHPLHPQHFWTMSRQCLLCHAGNLSESCSEIHDYSVSFAFFFCRRRVGGRCVSRLITKKRLRGGRSRKMTGGLKGQWMKKSTGHDVLADDVDVIVAIGSRVLVPEADHVTQFVDDDAELVAVFADGNCLSAVAAFTYKRTASTASWPLILHLLATWVKT